MTLTYSRQTSNSLYADISVFVYEFLICVCQYDKAPYHGSLTWNSPLDTSHKEIKVSRAVVLQNQCRLTFFKSSNDSLQSIQLVKFIYSEKATKFCEIFTLLLSYVVPVKSKVKILQKFVAFLEYMKFSYQLFF